MNTYLIDLLKRMTTREVVTNSNVSVSWNAHREAEKLNNIEYANELMRFVETEDNKEIRDNAYFVIAKIALNAKYLNATEFLIKRLEIEINNKILRYLLMTISGLYKPANIDINPIIEKTKHKNRAVRRNAIFALANTQHDIAEETLINFLKSSNDEDELINANAALNGCGTQKAIPSLELHINSKVRDVRDSAKFAIEEIKLRNNL